MKRVIFNLLSVFVVMVASLQANAEWIASPSYPKAFIENKAQFNGRNKLESSRILYAIDHGPFQVYFTKEGLTYRLDNKLREKESDRNSRDHAKEEYREIKERMKEGNKIKMISDLIHMEWVNSNPNVEIIASDVTPDYFSYAMGSNNINYNYVKGYRKLLYKNLYPGIDVEYEFHPVEGFKYSFIIHPGADPSVIQMKFNKKAKISQDVNGNLKFATQFGFITDHAPVSFYGDNKDRQIVSSFNIANNTVSFNIAGYDRNKTLVIDPWTVFPVSPNSNKVWEVETDAAGNTYTYSGDMPFTLRKYNTAGALQWTYLSPWDSAGYWVGGMIVHPSGDTYMTSGSNGEIRKISTAGSQVWFNNPNALTSYEYWSLSFNCDLTKLVIGGSRLQFPAITIRGVMVNINLNTGAQLSYTVVGYGSTFSIPPNIQEVSSICYAPNGNYYFITLDTVGSIKDDLTTINFKEATGYKFDYYIPGYGFGTKQPISAIRANSTAFYTVNGITIDKRDLNTGLVVASAAIPNGISNNVIFGTKVQGNGGIDIDSCGNVYVGSGNGVYKFDANLNLVGSATTPGPVYDVDINTTNGEVSASGNNYVASVNLSACHVPVNICITTLTAIASSTDIECSGECTGTATAGAIAGNPPYTYLWSNGQTTQAIGSLCAGTYTVTVTDINGLFDTASVTISSPLPLTATSSTVDATCGANNGSATVTPAGGTSPFTYSWSPTGGTGASATGLAAGTYDVTITDANGCSIVETLTVNSNGGPQVTIAALTDVTCFGGADGSATVTASSGAPPYNYSWNTVPVQTGATATGLPAGTYTVTVTDNLGCINTKTVIIAEPAQISTSTSVLSNATCGQPTGSASVTASGGTPGFTYNWSTTPPQTGTTATNLTAGTYYVVITDANSCSVTDSVTIADSGAPTVTVSSQTDPQCSGGANGSATASASAGNPPYTYLWSTTPAQTGSTATGLSAGTYTVTVTDQGGCSATQTVTLTEPSAITTTSSSTPASCGQANGSVTVNASGGTPGYTYSWNTTPVQTTPTATGLPAGTYIATVTDANGCTATQSVTVTEPSTMSVSTTSSSASCGQSNGSATANVTGGSPTYTYSWNTTPVQTTQTATSLIAGTYIVTVTDANGCTATQTVTVNGSPAVTASASSTPICGDNNGSATASPSGGTAPFTYQWSPAGGTGATATGLSSGTYSVTVTDANGCSSTTTVNVVTYPDVVANAGADVTIITGNSTQLSASGGSSYTWSPATGLSCTNCADPVASPDVTTTYCVLVTDANGCTGTACVKVTVDIACGEVYVPNAFSPDGSNDPENEKQCVYGRCIQDMEFAIYTRWGEKVFESSDQKKCWDGTYKGKKMNTGVFVYYLKATLLDGTKITRKGDISLIR